MENSSSISSLHLTEKRLFSVTKKDMDTQIDGIKKWLKKFAHCVRSLDFDGGREMFFQDAVCFGSKAEVLIGLDDLIERQWKAIWPNITDFTFQMDQFRCECNNTADVACVIVPWISTGYHQDGTPFPRPGRMTALLLRDRDKDTWLAKHTHFSLNPAIPNQTFARPNPGK